VIVLAQIFLSLRSVSAKDLTPGACELGCSSSALIGADTLEYRRTEGLSVLRKQTFNHAIFPGRVRFLCRTLSKVCKWWQLLLLFCRLVTYEGRFLCQQ
jgi:hypothetical protein